MAATLGKLIIFVLFISFRPITSEEDVEQKGKPLKHVSIPPKFLKKFLTRGKKLI